MFEHTFWERWSFSEVVRGSSAAPTVHVGAKVGAGPDGPALVGFSLYSSNPGYTDRGGDPADSSQTPPDAAVSAFQGPHPQTSAFRYWAPIR